LGEILAVLELVLPAEHRVQPVLRNLKLAGRDGRRIGQLKTRLEADTFRANLKLLVIVDQYAGGKATGAINLTGS
jgi:hypothetical protein